ISVSAIARSPESRRQRQNHTGFIQCKAKSTKRCESKLALQGEGTARVARRGGAVSRRSVAVMCCTAAEPPPLIAFGHRLLPMYVNFKVPTSGKPEIGGDLSPSLAGEGKARARRVECGNQIEAPRPPLPTPRAAAGRELALRGVRIG